MFWARQLTTGWFAGTLCLNNLLAAILVYVIICLTLTSGHVSDCTNPAS